MGRPSIPALTALGLAVSTAVAVVVAALGAGGVADARVSPGARRPTSVPPATVGAHATPAAHRLTTPSGAWVKVSVATVWRKPDVARRVDRPALSAHPQIRRWIRDQTGAQQVGLDTRVLTQAVRGDQVEVLRTGHGWSAVRVPDQRGSRFPRGIVGWVPSRQLTTSPARPTQTRRPAHPSGGHGRPGRSRICRRTVSVGRHVEPCGRLLGLDLSGLPQRGRDPAARRG